MQGLLLKLSALDEGAENAVRLISFFDSLVEQQVDIRVLLRSAAVVAECDVGMQDDGLQDKGLAVRATPGGVVDDGRCGPGATVRPLCSGRLAWIGRSGESALPLDAILLERLAIACIATLGGGGPTLPALGDPALLELVISRSTAAPERTRALQLLGFNPSGRLTLLAVHGPDEAPAALAKRLGGARPRWARLGAVHVIAAAVSFPPDLALPPGVTVGVGPTLAPGEAPGSWERAVRALRFADSRRPLVRAADLGPYELLAAHLRSSDIREVHDVDVLDQLAADPAGVQVVRTLEVMAEVGSLREAARHLHLHHNSVAARVRRAEHLLGYRLTDPPGWARIGLALVLRRLRDRDLAL